MGPAIPLQYDSYTMLPSQRLPSDHRFQQHLFIQIAKGKPLALNQGARQRTAVVVEGFAEPMYSAEMLRRQIWSGAHPHGCTKPCLMK